jgi:hypothetical protein
MGNNQYTKAEAEGKEKPKGANQFTTGKREKHDQATIDKIRAERAAQVAEEIMNDPKTSSADKLAAAKVLLPFGKSTLQSIEQRQINEFEEMSVEEVKEMAKALILSRPQLVIECMDADPGFKAALRSALDGQPVVVEAIQRTAA